MQLSLKLVSTNAQIGNDILLALKSDLNECLRLAAIDSRREMRKLFELAITQDETWVSLHSGKLKGEFGLPSDGATRLREILNIWLDNIVVDYVPIRGTSVLKGSFSLCMFAKDWIDVINSNSATIITDKGQSLPWLEWLLKFGDKTIVKEYTVKLTNSVRSRSGLALMKKDVKGKWRVPLEFSGTNNNNFITKLIDSLDNQIINIIEQAIQKQF